MRIARNFILKLRELQWVYGCGSVKRIEIRDSVYKLLVDECLERDELFGTILGDFDQRGQMNIFGILIGREDGPWLSS